MNYYIKFRFFKLRKCTICPNNFMEKYPLFVLITKDKICSYSSPLY